MLDILLLAAFVTEFVHYRQPLGHWNWVDIYFNTEETKVFILESSSLFICAQGSNSGFCLLGEIIFISGFFKMTKSPRIWSFQDFFSFENFVFFPQFLKIFSGFFVTWCIWFLFLKSRFLWFLYCEKWFIRFWSFDSLVLFFLTVSWFLLCTLYFGILIYLFFIGFYRTRLEKLMKQCHAK